MTLLIPMTTAFAEAEIYRQVLPDGSVIYSDEPSPQAEVVELPPLQTIPAHPVITPAEETQQTSKAGKPPPYRRLRIISPQNEQQIRENSGRVEVEIEAEPAVQIEAGHRQVLKLDGQVVATISGMQRFTLENVNRGTHQLVAEIQDSKGKLLKTSPPVTFHLFRYSRLINPRSGN